MSRFCVDVGVKSLCKHGETLCGDWVEVVGQDDQTLILVLADGLGSGVKANILSTLTAKIISAMMLGGIGVEDCVRTMAATLPVCDVRKVAYSTFTIIKVSGSLEAEIFQYENPRVFLLRDGKNVPMTETQEAVAGKTIVHSRVSLRENDTFVAVSDGVIHAGVGTTLNFGWQLPEVIGFMEKVYREEHTAKMLTSVLLEQCDMLYGGKPGDDTTACTLKIRRRSPLNLLLGPPRDPEDDARMLKLFFSKEGRRIVCGGTTSGLVASFLGKPLEVGLPEYRDPKIPPTAKIAGVDLVTEGVITMSRVLEYARDFLGENRLYMQWSRQQDGASQIARMLFEQATDINFFVGQAANPAHQNPDLPIAFNIKMQLVEELTGVLQKIGKRIKVSYF